MVNMFRLTSSLVTIMRGVQSRRESSRQEMVSHTAWYNVRFVRYCITKWCFPIQN